jgi:carboxypeptidase C (cathepsin A)
VPEGRSREPAYVNVAPRLSRVMRRHPTLRVFVASGYYGYATPFFDAYLVFARYGFVSERVTMRNYETGHMSARSRCSVRWLATTLDPTATSISSSNPTGSVSSPG